MLLYGAVGETYNICDEAGECSVKDLAKRYATQKGSGVEVVFDLEGPHRNIWKVILGTVKRT